MHSNGAPVRVCVGGGLPVEEGLRLLCYFLEPALEFSHPFLYITIGISVRICLQS